MLHEFIATHRDEIITRTSALVAARRPPAQSKEEVASGVPLVLDQLIEILCLSPGAREALGTSAGHHGGDLLRRGFTVGQVIHGYGDICQVVTELAMEQQAPITNAEFHDFNRSLDEAIAQAVTEFERQRESTSAARGTERLALLAHELRNHLSTATLSFEVLKRGSVAIGGSTGAVLGRSLTALGDLINRSLAEVRLDAGNQVIEPIAVPELIEEIEVAAELDAKRRELRLLVLPVQAPLLVEGDRQLLAAALMNLLQNAFKFTRPRGQITLATHATADRVLIEVADQCGGLPPGAGESLFQAFAQRGADRSGLGLGLTIARRGVEGMGGQIHVRDQPGQGCTFTIDLPRLATPAP